MNDVNESNSFHFSEEKNTKWNRNPIKVNGRTRQHNIITYLHRVENAKTPHDENNKKKNIFEKSCQKSYIRSYNSKRK